jgi:hypothetical protein
MRYLVTIYINEKEEDAYTAEDWKRLDAGYAVFDAAAKKAGAYITGGPLEGASKATTVRVRSGRVMLTDGPFAETKEQLGGFFILDCPNVAAAVELVKLMPGAQSNCVEIRPFAMMED